jgi:hypothetical protein
MKAFLVFVLICTGLLEKFSDFVGDWLQKKKKKKKNLRLRGWGDDSAVKSTDCSSRGPEFNSQQPHGGSQPPVMGSDGLFWCV